MENIPKTPAEMTQGNKKPLKPQRRGGVWSGMSLSSWFWILSKNRFAVEPQYLGSLLSVFFSSFLRTLLGWWARLRYDKAVAATPIEHPPLFVLGHWRSGTTLLHELLSQDPRHAFPNTFECIVPNLFLLTEKRMLPILNKRMPKERPMDEMPMGLDLPQEDEFALCNMGIPSPYFTILFPNRPPQFPEYFDLRDLSRQARGRWQDSFVTFLKRLTYFKGQKRIVLKSPPHTARVRTLLEIFPGARFVFLTRDPYAVFASTKKLFCSLYETYSLQKPKFLHLEEEILDTYVKMHERFEEDKIRLSPNQLIETRYEDLVADPETEMARIYERLDLGDFGPAWPPMKSYLEKRSGHRAGKYELSPETLAKINERWGKWIARFGYEEKHAASQQGAR